MSFFDRLVASVLPVVPRPIVGHFSQRYIAGPGIDDAVEAIRRLGSDGCRATVDILGENVSTLGETDAVCRAYLDLVERIDTDHLDSNVSVKLTALGLTIAPARCAEHLRSICRRAAELGNFVRIDMEDSSVTQATLDLYRSLRGEFSNVGPVIQSCLRRSHADVAALVGEKANVRLCKGIYIEPRAISYRDRDVIRRSYVDLLDMLLGGGCYVGIATHDEVLVYEALRIIRRLRLTPDRYEFQMLLGVEEELRRLLVRDGHRMRVYVPYGAQWYAYSMRRLKENPSIAGHILRNVFRRPELTVRDQRTDDRPGAETARADSTPA